MSPRCIEEGEAPEEYVARLSRDKAQRAGERSIPSRWVIAADTTVLLGDQLLEKPVDAADAARMLGHDRRTDAHRLHRRDAARTWSATIATRASRSPKCACCRCRRRRSSGTSRTGEPLDKAGAYAVQGIGAMFIESIHGSYTNVVGLPLATLFQMLRRAGIDPLAGTQRDVGVKP